jgi:hypothetical protein
MESNGIDYLEDLGCAEAFLEKNRKKNSYNLLLAP